MHAAQFVQLIMRACTAVVNGLQNAPPMQEVFAPAVEYARDVNLNVRQAYENIPLIGNTGIVPPFAIRTYYHREQLVAAPAFNQPVFFNMVVYLLKGLPPRPPTFVGLPAIQAVVTTLGDRNWMSHGGYRKGARASSKNRPSRPKERSTSKNRHGLAKKKSQSRSASKSKSRSASRGRSGGSKSSGKSRGSSAGSKSSKGSKQSRGSRKSGGSASSHKSQKSNKSRSKSKSPVGKKKRTSTPGPQSKSKKPKQHVTFSKQSKKKRSPS